MAERMATSAIDPPRNNQMSPVDAAATASWSESAVSSTGLTYATMRIPWKVAGLAGLAGVAATGAVLARRRRAQRQYHPDELRERLHRRLAEASSGDLEAGSPATYPAKGG